MSSLFTANNTSNKYWQTRIVLFGVVTILMQEVQHCYSKKVKKEIVLTIINRIRQEVINITIVTQKLRNNN